MKWLPILVFALFGYFLVGANFSAKLGMIDDHEIPMFLGGDGRIKLSEIPSVIMSTEVGRYGEYLRFRPSYFTLRVLETALWRDNAMLWYGARYLMLVLSLWLGWKILARYFPKIVAYLFVFYAMTMPFWPDLLTRLGPSEIYTVPAVLMFVYGMINNKLWILALGYAICVGSKENFLILFPILLGYAGYRTYMKKITKGELLTYLILFAYTIFITAGIMIATGKAKTDVYGTAISYRYRVTKFLWDIPMIIKNRHMLPALLALAGGITLSAARGYRSRVLKYVALMIVLLIVIASQYIFYTNQLPTNMRYDFPALLLFPILDLIALKMMITLFAKHKHDYMMTMIVYAAIAAVCSIYIFHRGFALVQIQSKNNSESTRTFAAELSKVETVIKNEPEATIMFVSDRYGDFEAIISVERYLNSRSVSNKFMLFYRPEKITAKPFELELQSRLVKVMEGSNGTDHIFDRFVKYDETTTPCFSIVFYGAAPLLNCQSIAKF